MGIIVALLALVAAAGICGFKLYQQAMQVKDHETKALASISNISQISSKEGIEKLRSELPNMQQETKRANEIAHTTLWNVAAKVPFVGKNISTVQGMTAVVDDLAATTIPQFFDAMDSLQNANLSAGEGINLQPIIEVQQKIEKANDSLQRETQTYNALQRPSISVISQAYELGHEKINSVANTVGSLADTVKILPELLGSNGQTRTYAIMAMTTSEMRSSGGLVGSVGEMTATNGNVSISDFRSNAEYEPYGVSDRTEDEKRIFGDEGPLNMTFDIRDITSCPDTKRVAENMRSIWNRTSWGKDRPLDGIILVDPVFVQKLVAITGNVTMADGTVLNGSNTAEFLLNTAYIKYPSSQTDAVFGVVASQVLDATFKNITTDKLVQVAQIMGSMAKERHLNIYMFDEKLEKTFMAAGFTATEPNSEQNPQIGVYLNEQNPSKMGWYIDRSAKINEVSKAKDGSVTYHVEYTLRNTMTAQEAKEVPQYISGDNGKGIEKILFYPPAGGEISNIALLGGSVNSVTKTSLNGKAAYESIVTVSPGQSATYSFDVTTSPKAQTVLTVDQTPMGQAANNVTYEK